MEQILAVHEHDLNPLFDGETTGVCPRPLLIVTRPSRLPRSASKHFREGRVGVLFLVKVRLKQSDDILVTQASNVR
jgi:hypothetical protein